LFVAGGSEFVMSQKLPSIESRLRSARAPRASRESPVLTAFWRRSLYTKIESKKRSPSADDAGRTGSAGWRRWPHQLGNLGYAYARLGQVERATRLVGAESRRLQELQLFIEPTHLRIRELAVAEVRGTLAAERVDELLAEGRAMSLDEAVECALSGDP
jgi:hypothetical protein